MKKSDKKIDKALREALTQVCETALDSIAGFVWLTHLVNYRHFPDSLRVVCVFASAEQLSMAYDSKQTDQLCRLIREALLAVNIHLKNTTEQVSFDSEEACLQSHQGKWNERLSKLNLH